MNILGINYFYHDSTACLVQDGRLTVALEEERLTRQKHTKDFPVHAVARCLDVADLTPKQIDHVAVSIKPSLYWTKKVIYGLKLGVKVRPFFEWEVVRTWFNQKALRAWFDATFSSAPQPKLHFVPHHFSHVIGSFLVSPYESAALLSVDGAGEWATTFKGVGRANTYECFGQDYFPMSLGSVYEAATEFCGFRPNYDEGKTMGLAPLGDPDTFTEAVSKIFWILSLIHI